MSFISQRPARGAALSLLALALSFTTACGGPEESGTKSDGGKDVIKVGVPANANSINAHLAAEKYFADAGLDVEFVEVTSGAAAIPMLLNGQLDISQGDGVGTFAAAGNGVPIAIAGISTVQTDDPELDPTGIFVADKKTDAAALSGETLAVTQLGGAAELVARSAVDAEGGDSSKIEFVELQVQEMGAAIGAGRVKAALITEPYASGAEKAGLTVLTRPQASGAPGLPAVYWTTTLEWGEKNGDALSRFITAVGKAGRDANADPELARATAADFLGLDPDLLAGIRLSVYAEDPTDTSKVSDFLELANNYSVLEKQPDLEKLLSLDVQESAG